MNDWPCKYGIWREGVFSISSVYWLIYSFGLRSPASTPKSHARPGRRRLIGHRHSDIINPGIKNTTKFKHQLTLFFLYKTLMFNQYSSRFVSHSYCISPTVLLKFFWGSQEKTGRIPKETQKNFNTKPERMWMESDTGTDKTAGSWGANRLHSHYYLPIPYSENREKNPPAPGIAGLTSPVSPKSP